MDNDVNNSYNLINNTEENREIIQKLLNENISFDEVVDFDLPVLKSLFEEFDESIIEKFWNDLQELKGNKHDSSRNKTADLSQYEDICKILFEENKLMMDDLLNLEDDNIKLLLTEINEERINEFMKELHKIKKNNKDDENDEITHYFKLNKIYSEFSSLIEGINQKNKFTLQELLAMTKEEISNILIPIELNESLKQNFLSIIDMENFFKKNSFSNKLFENIKCVCLIKKIFLDKLINYSNTQSLELILFLSFTNLEEILPKDFINKLGENVSINKLYTKKDEELKNNGLNENELKLLKNAIEISKQCNLRNFSIFSLNYDFVAYVCKNNISMKEIDKWSDTDYEKIPNLTSKDDLKNLFNQKSQNEIFLNDMNISLVDKNVLEVLKYMEYDTLKTWNLNFFMKINAKLVPLYQDIIKKMKIYDPQDKFKFKNLFNEFEIKLKEYEREIIKNPIVIKMDNKDYQNKILSLNKDDTNYYEELNRIFYDYSDSFNIESNEFYKNSRNTIGKDLEYYINEEYYYELVSSLKSNITKQLSETDCRLYKSKIDNLLRYVQNNREEIFDNLIVNFGNSKNIDVFIIFLTSINEILPMVFDKFFPPYMSLFLKYKGNKKIIETFIDLCKELIELKHEEEMIISTRNLIKKLSLEGEEFLKELYDKFPDLENYLYFQQDNKTIKKNSLQYKLCLLLRSLNSDLGSSFLSNFLDKNKSLVKLGNLAIQEECGNLKSNNLEVLIQQLNNECGEFFKSKVLNDYPDLSCTKHLDLPLSTSIQQLLSKLNNEIDPYFVFMILDKYPEFKEIPVIKANENYETITDLLQELNKCIGYHRLEYVFNEFPELKLFKSEITPNVISEDDMNLLETIETRMKENKNQEFVIIIKDNLEEEMQEKQENKKSFECKNDQERSFHDKIIKKDEIESKIRQKILNKVSTMKEIDEKIDFYIKQTQKILLLRDQKNQIEQEIFDIIKEKNLLIEEIKKHVSEMINKLKKTFNLLKILDSLDNLFVNDFYNIFPKINSILSIPKNNQILIREEREEFERLLKRTFKKDYEISDLLEINYLNDNEKMLRNIILRAEEKNSIEESIVNLFFDCIKRKESFSENLRKIQKVLPKFRIMSTNLLEYLIKESTTNLKIMLLHICSKFIPLPFLIKNQVELIEDNSPSKFKENYTLLPELALLLEDSSTNVISFCFSENKIFFPKGKSYILNYFFCRSFITEEKLRNKTTIEFQFDYHYANSMNFNIADYHGVADLNILLKLVPFFNYYFLHVKFEELQNFKQNIDKLIEQIKPIHSEFIFIVFIHQVGFPIIEVVNIEKGVFYITINEIRPMSDLELKNLKDEVWKTMFVHDTRTNPFYVINSVKNKYLEICRNLSSDEEISPYQKKLIKVENFISYLSKYQENFLDISLLPFNQTFVNYSQKKKIYNTNYNEWNENKKNEEQKSLEILMEHHKSQPIPEIVSFFYDLLYDDCFLGNLLDSSSRVKLMVEKGLSNIYKERNKLIEEISKNKDDAKKDFYESEKQKIMEIIQKKSFSYELIVRELYHIYKNEKIDINLDQKRYFQKVLDQLILCGQPFEIIDGDNLHFISDFYPSMFKNDNSSILVVSIMGPQSAGKSTLLNFLFGTQFASSSGRCTKGMYGAIMNINNHPKYQKMLILDTEGILSAERNDHLFDKKLILYCLCVSHVTILCNKGDIHKGMTDVLKLTSECMKDLKEQKFIDPNIFVVLNALTDISEKLMVPFQNLDVKLTGIRMLPFAYEMKDVHSDIKVNVPSTSFSQKCWDFRMEILNQYKQQGNTNTYTLSEWFDFSQKLWEKIDKFKNLINYINIEELLQDKQLAKLIENLVNDFKNYMSSKSGDNNKLNEIVDDCCKNFELQNFKVISNNTYNRIDNDTFVVKEEYSKKFEQECIDRNISPELMKKRKILLEKNMNIITEDWKLIASKILNEKKIKFSKAGDFIVNEELDKLVKANNNQPFLNDEAMVKFNEFWKTKIEESILKSIIPLKERKEECFQRVKKNYECCTTLLLFDPQVETELKEFFEKKEEEIIINVFKKNEILFFKEGTLPDMKELYKYNRRKGKYINLDQTLFQKEEVCDIVKICIYEGFDRSYVSKKLYTWGKKVKGYMWKSSRIKDLEKDLRLLFNQIKTESNKLHITFDFDNKFIETCAELIEEGNSKDFEFQYENLEIFCKNIATMIFSRLILQNIPQFHETSEYFYYFFPKKLYNYYKYSSEEYEKIKKDPDVFLVNKIIKYKVNPDLDPEVKRMLSWYVDPHNPSNSMTTGRIKLGISFVQNFFNWKKILKRIFLFVYKSIYKETNLKKVNFVEEIDKIRNAIDKNEDINHITQNYSDLNTKVIHSLISETDFLINDINNEINQFRFQINQQATGIFHETVLMLFWNLYSILEQYKAYEPLRINNKNKGCLQNFFVSVLTKDTAKIDKDSSNLVLQQILDNIYNSIKLECQDKFTTGMKAFGVNFQPHNTMKYLDDLIMNGNENIEVILQFMLNPKKKLEDIFEKEWEDKKSKVIKSIQDYWINDVESKLKLLKSLFKDFYEKLKNSGLLMQSINLFTVINCEKLESMAQAEYEKEFEKLVGKYIYDSIDGKWENVDHLISNSLTLKQIKPFPKILVITDENLKGWILQHLHGKPIGNVSVYLTEIISKIDEELGKFKTRLPDVNVLDTENLKKTYQDSFIGCQFHCPLCGRKCDETHSNLKPKHKCITGHQFKVFGGSKYENHNPSFTACNLMKDQDEVIFEGNIIKWSEFKIKQNTWDYESNSLETVEILEKNKKIWSLIGKRLCQHYTLNGNPINYSEWKENSIFIPKIHLILLLDDSGSMGCTGSKPGVTRWQELIEAVRNTFLLILNNQTLKNTIKVSVFIHESTTKNCFLKQEVSLNLIDLISPRYGGNNFEYALSAGYDCILNSQNEFDIFTLGFMSDGGCSYPSNIISKIILDERNVKKKIKLNCIMFGKDVSGVEVQKKIASSLGGNFTQAITFEQLQGSFKEIINVGFK